MKPLLQPPKGTRDFFGKDMYFMDSVFERISATLESFGYSRIETPAFEYFDVLAKKSGEEIEKQLYTFEDKGGRKLALRFDGTIPIARIIAQDSSSPKPVRLYYLGKFWRYEDPQAGRFREFYQAGIELIGPASRIADAESLACLVSCLKNCGLTPQTDFNVLFNSRKILSGFASSIGITDPNLKNEFFRIIDKKDKISRAELERLLKTKIGLDSGNVEQVLELVELAGNPKEVLEQAKSLLNPNSEISEGLCELDSFIKYIYEFGILDCCRLDFGIARGLDYYTSLIYEVRAEGTDDRAGMSFAGGGRYDELIGTYGGQELPATGWAIGIDRLIDVVRKKGKESALLTPSAPSVLVVPLDDKMERLGIRVSNKARAAGLRCQIDVMSRNLTTCLEYANKIGMNYVVIVGEKDAEQNSVTVKDMQTRDDRLVKLDGLEHFFKSKNNA